MTVPKKRWSGPVAWALAIGIALRFTGLGRESLWFDELLSAVAATASSLAESFTKHLVTHTHPPGYGVFLYGWAKIFGDSEIALRMPSALAGAASLFIFYRMMSPFFAPAAVGTATILMALTFPGLYFSQEGRPYTILALLATVTTALWLRMLPAVERNEELEKPLVARYLAFALLTIYTHYFGLALVAFQGLYFLALARKHPGNRKLLLLVAGALLLAFLPWVSVMAQTARSYWGAEQAGRPGLRWFLFWLSFNLYNKSLLSALAALALLGIPAALNWSQFTHRVRQLFSGKEDEAARVRGLAYLLVVPTAVLMLVSQHTNVLGHRFLMILCPAFYLSLGLAMACATAAPERLALCVCLIALAVEVPKYAHPHKEQWREAVQLAVRSASPGDGFVAVTYPELFEHYFRREGKSGALASVPNTAEALCGYARELSAKGAKTLFILEAREPGFPAATEELLRKSTRREEKTAFKDATVYAFKL